MEEPEPEEEVVVALLEEEIPIDLNNHYVNIKNNKSEEPPEDPKYFAPINSVVDEETRAENTNLDVDDGESAPPQEDSPLDDKPGDSLEDVVAHEI